MDKAVILVADDEAPVRGFVETAGYAVLTAADGERRNL